MRKNFAVIGDPIGHSKSPEMHNKLFAYYELNAHYKRVLIKRGSLQEGIEQLRVNNFAGFNVTIPHKADIIPFLDEIDHLAAEIGAVNTVVNDNGRLIGYNTDGIGYVRGLQQIAPELQKMNILIIGAGGAAKAIYFTLANIGVENIDIVNRTYEKSERLISSCPYKINSTSIPLIEADSIVNKYDIIIQTTSIGMSPNVDESPISLKKITKGTIVSDIIYNPLETKFLKEAKQYGAIIQNGLPMFIYQGALAFEKWTGIFPNIKLMKKTVLNNL